MSILPASNDQVNFKPLRCLEPARKARKPRRPTRPRPRPSVNPRLRWPDWTDAARWETSDLVMGEGELHAWSVADRSGSDDELDLGFFASLRKTCNLPDGDTTDHTIPFEPSAIEAAWWLGYQLGVVGEYPAAPGHFTSREAYHFRQGRVAGFMDSPAGLAWKAEMDASRDRPSVRTIHHAELVEGAGIDAARSL